MTSDHIVKIFETILKITSLLGSSVIIIAIVILLIYLFF